MAGAAVTTEPEPELPELDEAALAELDALDPEAFTHRPEPAAAIQLKDVEPMRRWVRKVMTGQDFAQPIGVNESAFEAAVHHVVEGYRKAGIDLYDPEHLLEAMFSYQEASTDIFRAVNTAPLPDNMAAALYLIVAGPILNQSFAYELLVLSVFGDQAALPDEEVK